MVTACSPRSPWRLSSSLKPELAEDGGWTGDGASSPLVVQLSLPFVMPMSPILDTPFLLTKLLLLSAVGLAALLFDISSSAFLSTDVGLSVGDRGLPTLGVTWWVRGVR